MYCPLTTVPCFILVEEGQLNERSVWAMDESSVEGSLWHQPLAVLHNLTADNVSLGNSKTHLVSLLTLVF